jgi:hypothetical protein
LLETDYSTNGDKDYVDLSRRNGRNNRAVRYSIQKIVGYLKDK